MGKRKMFLWYQILIYVTVLHNVYCYPDGMGVDDSCSDLTPQHGASTQTSTAPYSIVFSPPTFTPGQSITVTLASSSSGFKGFMIQARRADTNQNQELLGSFSGTAATRQACSGKALVHSSKTVKSSLTFTWTAPTTSDGNITFRVTYLQSERTFWANRASTVLVAAGTPSTTTTTTTAAKANATTIALTTSSLTTSSPKAVNSTATTKAGSQASTTKTTTQFSDPNSACPNYSTKYKLFILIIALVCLL